MISEVASSSAPVMVQEKQVGTNCTKKPQRLPQGLRFIPCPDFEKPPSPYSDNGNFVSLIEKEITITAKLLPEIWQQKIGSDFPMSLCIVDGIALHPVNFDIFAVVRAVGMWYIISIESFEKESKNKIHGLFTKLILSKKR